MKQREYTYKDKKIKVNIECPDNVEDLCSKAVANHIIHQKYRIEDVIRKLQT
jgi:hypothetical protein